MMMMNKRITLRFGLAAMALVGALAFTGAVIHADKGPGGGHDDDRIEQRGGGRDDDSDDDRREDRRDDATPTPIVPPTISPLPPPPARGDDDVPGLIEVRGVVQAIPASGVGAWQVGGVTYVAGAGVRLRENKANLAVGACVQVKYVVQNGQNVAIAIKAIDRPIAKCTGS
jgi:hypothetical protein